MIQSSWDTNTFRFRNNDPQKVLVFLKKHVLLGIIRNHWVFKYFLVPATLVVRKPFLKSLKSFVIHIFPIKEMILFKTIRLPIAGMILFQKCQISMMRDHQNDAF